MDISHDIIEAGARFFAVNPDELTALGGMDGVVFAYTRNDTHRAYVLKFTPIPGFAPVAGERIPAVRAKLDFVNYLSANGVSVAKPITSVNGEYVETLPEPDGLEAPVGQVYVITSSERAPGKQVFEANEWNSEMFEEWGRMIGQMHRLTSAYDAQRTWPDGVIGDWEGEHYSFALTCKDNEVRARWFALGDELRAFTPDPSCYGLIHNDAHQFNFMVRRKNGKLKLTLFDFDVCAYHWFMTDIGVALFHALWARRPAGQSREEFAVYFIKHLMRGYNRENAIDVMWFRRLPIFLSYRRMLLYMVFSHEWKNPTPEQTEELRAWRQSIVMNTPVVDVDWA
jgi:Ser/Thr protein kinase RdoA (MazF antagonist)